MFSFGFCYDGSGTPGYNQMGLAETDCQAEAMIREKLKDFSNVTFELRKNKYRAYVDGKPTGYIYFSVQAEKWVAIENGAEPKVVAFGSLESVKRKVKRYIKKDHLDNRTTDLPETFEFAGRANGRRKTVNITYPGEGSVAVDVGITLVRVS